MKRIISLLIIIATIFSTTSVLFSYAVEVPTTGKLGDNITFRLDEKSGTLYIEGSGKMYNWTTENCDKTAWYKLGDSVKHIVMSDNITNIGDYAFFSQNAKTIEIGKDVKSIGKYAFSQANIVNLVIPDKVETIGKGAFSYCYDLESVSFGRSLKTIGEQAFYLDYALIYDTSYHKYGKYLKRITVPENVTKIGHMAFGYGSNDDITFEQLFEDFVLVGKVGSGAYKYCEDNAVSFDDIDGCKENTHTWGKRQTLKEKVCDKSKAKYCKQCIRCGSRRFEFGKSRDHRFLASSEKVLRKSTFFQTGKIRKYCLDCNKNITIERDKKLIPSPIFTVKKGKNKVTIKITNNTKYSSYYKVTVYRMNKYGLKVGKSKTYTVRNKKLTVKNLKKNSNYNITVKSFYKKGKKVATNYNSTNIKTKK